MNQDARDQNDPGLVSFAEMAVPSGWQSHPIQPRHRFPLRKPKRAGWISKFARWLSETFGIDMRGRAQSVVPTFTSWLDTATRSPRARRAPSYRTISRALLVLKW